MFTDPLAPVADGILITISELLGDRIQLTSVLIVLSFVGVFALSSQSAASYPTYLLAAFLLINVRRWNDVFRVRYLWVVLLLLAYLVSSSLWSEPFEWREVLSVASRAILILTFVVGFAECALRDRLWIWLRRSLAIVGFGAAIVALYIYFNSWHYEADIRFRGLGQLDNPNIAALIFGAVLLLAVDMLFREASTAWKVLGVMCLGAMVVAIYHTDSRSGWVSVSIGLSVMLLARYIRDPQKFLIAVSSLGVVVLALLSAMVANEAVSELVLPRGGSHRIEIWISGIEMVVQHNIWFGLGIGTPDQIEAVGQTFSHPHSLYVSVLFQGGLIALVLFLTLVVWTISELFANYVEDDAKLAISLLALALSGYMLDGHELVDKVSDVWFLFWLPVAICLGKAWRNLTQVEESLTD